MADISKEDVKKLARLSGLRIDEHDVARFQGELTAILHYVDQLAELDTDGVEPTYQVTDVTHMTRPDEVQTDGVTREQLLANTPEQKDGQIKVPKVLT